MTSCSHQICGKQRRVWFSSSMNNYGSIEKHPYCTSCGAIQNISDDRPKDVGYWMNKLGYISHDLRLTQVQKRLIAKELEHHEYFHDTFSSFGSSQKELFIQIVSKHVDISRVDLDTVFPMKLNSK